MTTDPQFDEACWVIEGLLDVADECPDGDDCKYSECPYHRAISFLTSHGREP